MNIGHLRCMLTMEGRIMRIPQLCATIFVVVLHKNDGAVILLAQFQVVDCHLLGRNCEVLCDLAHPGLLLYIFAVALNVSEDWGTCRMVL